jgi:hypothetical protein
MKAIGDVVAQILVWLFVAALVFVFQGSPDLWDKWHAAAMGDCKCPSVGKSAE